MFQIKGPILAAMDLEKGSGELLRQADALARSYKVKLSVCHVLPEIFAVQPITTPFDMTVLNDLDRFHIVVMDTMDRLPQTGEKGIYLKQQLKDKRIEHKQYIAKHGEDLPEIRNWKWSNPK